MIIGATWSETLAAHRPALGITITLSDPIVAEAVGASGADWMMVDLEHSTCSPHDLEAIALAADHTRVPVLARVADNRQDAIQHVLDVGAAGVIVPRVNSAAEAARAVAFAKYPPRGQRGYGPRRANRFGTDPAYVGDANRTTAVLVQVEHADAVEALESILEASADGIYVGPMDLAASMGHLGDPSHPTVIAAIEHTIEVCVKAGIPVGVGTGEVAMARRYAGLGASFLGVGGDIWLLAAGTRRLLESLRSDAPADEQRSWY